MRVVFIEDVLGVARGGDVKEVKNGFARNYLIPKNLAVPATHNALQRVEKLAKEAEATRLKTLSDMTALSQELEGVQVNVEMRAGVNGRLYGSVTSSIIAEELEKITGREIDRRTVLLSEPIRSLGVSEVRLRLHPEVETSIGVLVHAVGTDPEQVMAALEQAESDAEAADEAHEESAADAGPSVEAVASEDLETGPEQADDAPAEPEEVGEAFDEEGPEAGLEEAEEEEGDVDEEQEEPEEV